LKFFAHNECKRGALPRCFLSLWCVALVSRTPLSLPPECRVISGFTIGFVILFFHPNLLIVYISGSQYAQNGKYSFTFESKIKLKVGRNEIALLSVTVGLPVSVNYFMQVIIIKIFFLS
jgi:hypothetical protein